MTKNPIKLAVVFGVLGLPLAAYAQGFDYNDVSAVAPEYFAADRHAAGIIGQRAVTREDDNVGDVVDVIFDESNMVRGYIVDVGGFLGIDTTPLYVPNTSAKVRIDGVAVELVVDMFADEIKEDARLD